MKCLLPSSVLDVSSQDSLLILLSKPFLGEFDVMHAKQELQSAIDWEVFLSRTKQHRLQGIIYKNVTDHGLSIPDYVKVTLKKELLSYIIRNKMLIREIHRLSTCLAKSKLRCMLFKGPVLSEMVYASTLSRPFSDIDLLVLDEDIDRVESCLYEEGYLHGKLDVSLKKVVTTPKDRLGFRQFNTSLHRPPLVRVNDNRVFSIDLHYPGLGIGRFDMKRILEHATMSFEFGPGFVVPTLEDSTILACHHFYRHFRIHPFLRGCKETGALKYLADIWTCLYRLQRSADFCWDGLINHAQSINATELLLYGLTYVHLVYRDNVVSENTIDKMLARPICAPTFGNTVVNMDSVMAFVEPEITFLSSYLGMERFICPDKAYSKVMSELKVLKELGRACPLCYSNRVNKAFNWTEEETWAESNLQSFSNKQALPNQFFKTHISHGLGNDNSLKCTWRSMWSDDYIYLAITVKADRVTYTTPEEDTYGLINFYFSNIGNETAPFTRIALWRLQKGFTIKAYTCINNQKQELPKSKLSTIQVQGHCSGSSYQLYISIPWTLLGTVPEIDKKLGFDLEILQRTVDKYWSELLAWSGGHGVSSVYPLVHGTLQLV